MTMTLSRSRFAVATRVVVMLPAVMFFLSRQLVSNLTGIGKDALTVILVFGLAIVALISLVLRLFESRPDFLKIDALVFIQFTLALGGCFFYILSGISQPSEAVYSIYVYAVAPFLLYCGFMFARLNNFWKQALSWSCIGAYSIMLVAACFEVIGIDYWLFADEKWIIQRNFLGFGRATGLYGTQIDFGCLSFSFFCISFYRAHRERKMRYVVFCVMTALGALLSMSRVWIFATLVVLMFPFLRRQSVKQLLLSFALLCVLGFLMIPAANSLGLSQIIFSQDALTQQSNANRADYFHQAPQWLLEDYPLEGTGPGTQTGPDPLGRKFIGDFLWLGMLIDFGTCLGSLLVVLRLLLILIILRSCLKSDVRRLSQQVTVAFCLAMFLSSFLDSTYAHLVTLSLFYMVCGVALFENYRAYPLPVQVRTYGIPGAAGALGH